MKHLDRVSLAMECGMVLFVCTAGPASYLLWRSGLTVKAGYSLVVGIPAIATLGYVFLATLVPSLVLTRRIRYPINFTAPVVYGGLLMAIATLWTTTPVGFLENHEIIKLGRIWLQPGILVLTGGLGTVCLSMIALLGTRDTPLSDGETPPESTE
jgi:hypothetical protein